MVFSGTQGVLDLNIFSILSDELRILTHCGLMMPYGNMDLGQHWLSFVMACCLMALSHNLNQCWYIIDRVLWHSSDNNFTGSRYHFIKWIWKFDVWNYEELKIILILWPWLFWNKVHECSQQNTYMTLPHWPLGDNFQTLFSVRYPENFPTGLIY